MKMRAWTVRVGAGRLAMLAAIAVVAGFGLVARALPASDSGADGTRAPLPLPETMDVASTEPEHGLTPPPGEASSKAAASATAPSDAAPAATPAAPGEAAGKAAAGPAGPAPAMDGAAPVVLAAAQATETAKPPAPAQLAAAIAAILNDPMESASLGLKPAALEAMSRAYADRGFAAIWVGEQGLRLSAAILVEAFLRAGDDGLDPDDYLPQRVAGRSATAATDLARAELELSASLVRYATDLKVGRLPPTRTDSQGTVLRKEVDAAAILSGAMTASDLSRYLHSLAPANSLYAGLRRSLAEYRRAAGRGGWPEPAVDRLEPGSEGEPVARLREILRATGDLITVPDGQEAAPYDQALVAAVQSFQARHGLPADGVVGTETREAMAIGVEERIRQILLNMERVRWLPDDLGDPHIMVNLAGFTLSYVEAGSEAMSMRAIVGKPARSSPEFSGMITYLEVNPSWSVPRIIAVEDLLPKIRKDPRFLANNGFTLRTAEGGSIDATNVNWTSVRADGFPYALRQKAGPTNALGRVKFMFPNSFDVYLHDTPARGLFSQPVRAYSSGCIRLEKPVELAAKLLEANGNWSGERVRDTIARGETRSVILNRPVPVHLTYLTSWRDRDGTIQFRDDIYGRDRQMEAALAARSSRLVASGGPATVAAR